MKTIVRILVSVLLTSSLFVSCYDDSAIVERLDKLEGSTITSIKEQISAINASIKSFEEVQSSLKDEIADNTNTIEYLVIYDELLENQIADLKAYTDSAWASTSNWVEKSFCTLVKFDSLAQITKEIKELILTTETDLNNKIDSSIVSVKNWTTAVLKTYYTCGEVDFRLQELKDEIDKLNNRLTALEERFDSLMAELKKELDVIFSDNNIPCSAGEVFDVSYTIINGSGKTSIYTLGENGWKGTVKSDTDSTGVIEVKVPTPFVDGCIMVFLDDEMNKQAIRSLTFTEKIQE